MKDVITVQWRISRRLLLWSGFSIAAGALLLLPGGAFLQGAAVQAVAWGVIDALIAVIAMVRVRRTGQMPPDEYRSVRESLRLRRILLINAGLDLIYIGVGVALFLLVPGDPFIRGNGAGVVIQGGFLLFFDLFHAGTLPAQAPPWYDPAP